MRKKVWTYIVATVYLIAFMWFAYQFAATGETNQGIIMLLASTSFDAKMKDIEALK